MDLEHLAGRRKIDVDYDVHDHTALPRFLTNPALLPDATVAEEIAGDHLRDVSLFLALSDADHHARRRSVSKELTGAALRKRERDVGVLASEVSDALPSGQVVDLGDQFARPVAAEAALRFLGIDADPEIVATLAREAIGLSTSRRRRVAAAKLFAMARKTLASANPATAESVQADGAIQRLQHLGIEERDILGLVLPMLMVGVELTSRSILACVLHCIEEGSVSAIEADPDIDGIICAEGIVQTIDRVARDRVCIDEVQIETNQRVRIHLSSPGSNTPLPFGLGAHYCLGAAWVRFVSRCATQSLMLSWPATKVIGETRAPVDEQPGGLEELLVVLHR
jgi:cytochrome P450